MSAFQWCCLTSKGSPAVMQDVVSVESLSLIPYSIKRRFTSLIHLRFRGLIMQTEQLTKGFDSESEEEVGVVKSF